MYWYLGWAALPCCTRDTCNLHWHIWRSWAAGQGSAKAEGVTGQWLCAHTHTPCHLCWHWEPATKDLGQISLHFPKVLQLYEKDWGTKKGPNFKCRNDVWRLLHRKNLCASVDSALFWRGGGFWRVLDLLLNSFSKPFKKGRVHASPSSCRREGSVFYAFRRHSATFNSAIFYSACF